MKNIELFKVSIKEPYSAEISFNEEVLKMLDITVTEIENEFDLDNLKAAVKTLIGFLISCER